MKCISSGNYNVINYEKINKSISRVINKYQYNCYSSPKGIKELRIKITELIKDLWDFDVDYKNMLITTGSQQSINLIKDIILKEYDNILIEQPTYYGAMNVFKSANINMLGVNINDKGIDIEKLKKQVLKSNTKYIYVVPTFNNPTGYSWPNENRKEFLKVVNKYNLIVIEDDPYSMLNFSNEKYESLYKLNNGKNIIYLGTFSKLISNYGDDIEMSKSQGGLFFLVKLKNNKEKNKNELEFFIDDSNNDYLRINICCEKSEK